MQSFYHSWLSGKRRGKAVIKENDTKIIARFLEQIGIESEPESFTRLGKVNEGKRRTLTNNSNEK